MCRLSCAGPRMCAPISQEGDLSSRLQGSRSATSVRREGRRHVLRRAGRRSPHQLRTKLQSGLSAARDNWFRSWCGGCAAAPNRDETVRRSSGVVPCGAGKTADMGAVSSYIIYIMRTLRHRAEQGLAPTAPQVSDDQELPWPPLSNAHFASDSRPAFKRLPTNSPDVLGEQDKLPSIR